MWLLRAVTHHIDEFKVASKQCRENVLTWGRIASGEAKLEEDGTVTEVEKPAAEDETSKTAGTAEPAEAQP